MGQSGSREHRTRDDLKKSNKEESAGTYIHKGDRGEAGEDTTSDPYTKPTNHHHHPHHHPHHSSSSPPPSPPHTHRMEGGGHPAFLCDYLGYRTLNKPATSIAGLQPGIKELYLQFRKSLQPQGGLEPPPPNKSSFRITPGGLLVTLHSEGGGTGPPTPLEMFFDIACINFIQAVRFSVLKGSEKKKPKAVFVPIDPQDPTSASPSSPSSKTAGGSQNSALEKSAFSLDKPFHYLTRASHPPLLVCVLRRPKGVKALDLHVFGMGAAPETALHVQACVQQLMADGSQPAAHPSAFPLHRGGSSRGDFIRTEFGDYNVYRGSGGGGQQTLELKDEYFRGGGGGGVDSGAGGFPAHLDPTAPGPRSSALSSPRETYPADSADRPRFGWSYDKPQSGEEFRRISGGGQYVGGGGGGGGERGVRGEPGGMGMEGRPLSSELLRSSQDGRQAGSYSPLPHPFHPQGPSHDSRGFSEGDRRSADLAGGVGGAPPVSPRSEGPPRVMHKPVVSPLKGAGGVGRGGGGAPYSPTSPSTPPSSSPAGFPPLHHERQHLPLSPRVSAESPRTPTTPYSPTGGLGSGGLGSGGLGSAAQRPLSSSGSFREEGRGGPAFSLSNRESRGMEEGADDAGGGGRVSNDPHSKPSTPNTTTAKPVAKVPPHLKGVKVLPSDFLAVKLKPKQQRPPSEDGDHGYDNPKAILAQYQQLQLEEQRERDRLLQDSGPQEHQAGITAFHAPQPGSGVGDGDGFFSPTSSADKPAMSRSYSSNWNTTSDGPAMTASKADPNLADRYRRGFGVGVGGGGGGGVGGMSSAPPSSAANDEQQMGRKKDAEIASMFSGGPRYGGGGGGGGGGGDGGGMMMMMSPGRDEAFNPDRNNFEQSLGYLP